MVYVRKNMKTEEATNFFDNLKCADVSGLTEDNIHESIRQFVDGASIDLSVQLPNDSILARDYLVNKGFVKIN